MSSKSKGKMIRVVQVRSAIRRPEDQTQTLLGLGLTRMGRVRELVDTPSVRGMIEKVKHLITVTEVSDSKDK